MGIKPMNEQEKNEDYLSDELREIERDKVFKHIHSHFKKILIIIEIIEGLNNRELSKDLLKYIKTKTEEVRKKIKDSNDKITTGGVVNNEM